MITNSCIKFSKGRSTLRERRNDFEVKLALEQSQKTAAAHYDESNNVLRAFQEIQRKIEFGPRESNLAICSPDVQLLVLT